MGEALECIGDSDGVSGNSAAPVYRYISSIRPNPRSGRPGERRSAADQPRPEGPALTRRPGTEDEIRRALASAPATWDDLAKADPPNRLSSSALVFLIRSVRDSDRNLAGELIQTLNHRILQTARRWCRGFDPMTTEDILDKVLTEMLDRLLALHLWEAPYEFGIRANGMHRCIAMFGHLCS